MTDDQATSIEETCSLGEAFAELRLLCQKENYQLEIPAREDRKNEFDELMDELSL